MLKLWQALAMAMAALIMAGGPAHAQPTALDRYVAKPLPLCDRQKNPTWNLRREPGNSSKRSSMKAPGQAGGPARHRRRSVWCIGPHATQITSPLPFSSVWRGSHSSAPALASHNKENVMDEDRIKGSAEQAKGKVKEVAGKLTGDSKLEGLRS